MEVNKRNAETLEQVLNAQNNKISDQQKRIDLLNTAVSNLTEKLITLEKMLIIQKIKSMGNGPSA